MWPSGIKKNIPSLSRVSKTSFFEAGIQSCSLLGSSCFNHPAGDVVSLTAPPTPRVYKPNSLRSEHFSSLWARNFNCWFPKSHAQALKKSSTEHLPGERRERRERGGLEPRESVLLEQRKARMVTHQREQQKVLGRHRRTQEPRAWRCLQSVRERGRQ